MSLMTALAILGGVVLLVLLAHGLWSAQRASPRQAQRGEGDTQADARVEPVLDAATDTAAGVAAWSSSHIACGVGQRSAGLPLANGRAALISGRPAGA